MKTSLRLLVAVGALLLSTGRARAQDQDAGTPACMANADCAATPMTPFCCIGAMCMPANVCVACTDFTGNPCVPLACDGSLCDTTTGSTCTVGRGVGRARWGDPSLLCAVAVALAAALARRRAERRR